MKKGGGSEIQNWENPFHARIKLYLLWEGRGLKSTITKRNNNFYNLTPSTYEHNITCFNFRLFVNVFLKTSIFGHLWSLRLASFHQV